MATPNKRNSQVQRPFSAIKEASHEETGFTPFAKPTRQEKKNLIVQSTKTGPADNDPEDEELESEYESEEDESESEMTE